MSRVSDEMRRRNAFFPFRPVFSFSFLPPVEKKSSRDKYVKSRWPFSCREPVRLLLHKEMHMYGRSRGNVMILRANRVVARFFPYSFSPLFSFYLSYSSSAFSCSPFFYSRETAQVGFRDKEEKARRVSVYSRLFYRGALRCTWDLVIFSSFSFEIMPWLKFRLSNSVDAHCRSLIWLHTFNR